MAIDSNVGNPSLYEAGEQRTVGQAEMRAAQRNRENPPASSRRGSAHSQEQNRRHSNSSPTDDFLSKMDPTAPARMHGHKPSRGAQIDAELKKEDEERMKQKGYK